MTLRLILGDQLNPEHWWFQQVNDDVTYVMMEIRQETDYVRHHIQKIAVFFLAMRRFRDFLIREGHRVIYLALDDPANRQSLDRNIRKLIQDGGFDHFEYMEADEYRVDQQLIDLSHALTVPVERCSSEHFLCDRNRFQGLAKTPVMETFYRELRVELNILMQGDQPAGGQWNFDKENRKRMKSGTATPEPPVFEDDEWSVIIDLIQQSGIKTIGKAAAQPKFFATTRAQVDKILDHFLTDRLASFGHYQDAMNRGVHTAFHSLISVPLNLKLISPKTVVERTLAYWQSHPNIPLSSVEGFIRQIIGWREYVSLIYWYSMPSYTSHNYFQHTAPLPAVFWTGETNMRCLSEAIGQSLSTAYAHHIQRLMITGNYALLTRSHPDEVDAWYLGIYSDALQWVQLPNTRGMSQYADGGMMATKPYISGANYINKMSDYCVSCPFDPKQTIGPQACPFNSLYWQFIGDHLDQLSGNHRMAMMLRSYQNKPAAERAAIRVQAKQHLSEIRSTH